MLNKKQLIAEIGELKILVDHMKGITQPIGEEIVKRVFEELYTRDFIIMANEDIIELIAIIKSFKNQMNDINSDFSHSLKDFLKDLED